MNGKFWQRKRESGKNRTTQGAQGAHRFAMSALGVISVPKLHLVNARHSPQEVIVV
jgi:hypothetical protein